MKFKKYLLFTFLILTFNYASADIYEDDLSKCLSDNTSGKDRKDLAIWVFTVMASHPEILTISSIKVEDKTIAEKTVGKLYNRLLTEDCKPQIDTAYKNRSPRAIQSAFEQLGRLAMLELMSNEKVIESFSGPAKYINLEKLKPTQ